MNRIIKSTGIAVVLIIGIGGGGYYYLSQQAQKQIQTEIKQIEKQFPNLIITYENLDLGVLSKEVTLNKVEIKDKNDGQSYKADKILITPISNNQMMKLDIRHFTTNFDQIKYTIEELQLNNLILDPSALVIQDGSIRKFYPSKITFDLFQINQMTIDNQHGYIIKIGEYQLQNYGINLNSNQTLHQFESIEKFNNLSKILKVKKIDFKGLNLAQQLAIFEPFGEQFNLSRRTLFMLSQKLVETTHFDIFNVDNLDYLINEKLQLKIGQYQLKHYGAGQKTDQLLKQLSVIDLSKQTQNKDKNQLTIAKIEWNGLNFVDVFKTLNKPIPPAMYRSMDDYILQKFNNFISTLQFDLFNLEGVKFNTDSRSAHINLDQYQIKNVGLNRKTDLIIKQFDIQTFNNNPIQISLGLLKIDQYNFLNIMQQVLSGKIDYQQIYQNVPTNSQLEKLNISIKGNQIALNTFNDTTKLDPKGNIKDNGNLQNLTIVLQDNPVFKTLESIGYNQLAISGFYHLNYNKDQDIWSYDPIEINVQDLGKVNIKAALSLPNVYEFNFKDKMQKAKQDMTPQQNTAEMFNDTLDMMSKYSIHSLTSTLQLQGLIEHALLAQSKEQHVTIDEVKQKWLVMLDNKLEVSKDNNNEFQKQAIEAIKQIINHPTNQIIIDIKPDQAIKFNDLKNKTQNEIVHLLNLTIKTQS